MRNTILHLLADPASLILGSLAAVVLFGGLVLVVAGVVADRAGRGRR
ncbi:hypothetical protein ABZ215_24830 [Amycolatopsis sp. NPDC006131]